MISRRVRHLLVIAEEASITRAAERMGIAQPALSQSIQRLERDLGVLLLERTSRGVRLTPAGEAFLTHARPAVAAAERAKAAALEVAACENPVRLGVVLPAIWGALGDIVRLARAEGVKLRLIDGSTTELLDLLTRGELDVSFVTSPFDAVRDLTTIPIGREPLVAALPDDLARKPGPYASLPAMAERLILPPRSYGPVLHDEALRMFRNEGCEPVVVAETTRVMTMLALVSADVGAAIVAPSLTNAIRMEGVTFRPFDPGLATPVWELAIAHFPARAGTPLARLLLAQARRSTRSRPSPRP